MRPVQFRRDVRSQPTTSQRGRGEIRIGRGGKKVTTEREEHFCLSVLHRMNRSHRIESMISRRFEIKGFPESIQKNFSWPLPNTNRAIALHVAVPTHRTETRAWFADLASQQHQVDDLLDVCDCIAVLRQSHGPAEDRALRRDKDLGGLFDQILRDSTLLDDLAPGNLAQS